MRFNWLTEDVVLAIHDRLIAEHGGEPGLLDRRQLQSAMARPLHAVAYDDASIFVAASLYGHGIAKAHAFKDGNKRTAFMAAYTFLAKHGFEIDAPEIEATQVMLDVTTGALPHEQFARWLEKVSVPRKRKAT